MSPVHTLLQLVPGEGFEPPTFGLQNRCTATVLTRQFQWFSAFDLGLVPQTVPERQFVDLRRGILLHRLDKMRVDVERDPDRSMAQPLLNDLRMHGRGEQLARVRVPEAVKSDLRE